MTYDMSSVEGSENLLQMFVGVNNITGGLLSIMFIILIFVTMLIIMMRRNPVQESVIASGFVTVIVTLAFMAIQAIDLLWGLGIITITIIGAISLYYRS